MPVYIVHLSAQEAMAEVRAARDRGSKAFAETCPQYLFLSLDDLGHGFDGAKFVCSPPLRTDGPLGRPLERARQGRPADRLDRPLPVRLPRPEGARPRRLPQDPQRPARGRGPGRPAPRRRGRRRPDHAASAGSRSSRPRRRSCSGCTRRRARSRSDRTPTWSSTTRPRRHTISASDPPHGRRLLVLRGPRRSRAAATSS